MANGYRVLSHGVGTVNIFSSLSIDNVLYVPGSPFNLLSISRLTHSLDFVIYFTKDFVTLQDRSSGRMIGIGCESHGLFINYRSLHMLAQLWILHLSFMLGWVILVLPRCSSLFQVCLMCLLYRVSRVS